MTGSSSTKTRKFALLLEALALVLISPSLAMAVFVPVPGDFFANIDDVTDVTRGSLSDHGYIPATSPFTVGGSYTSQPGAVGSITNEGPGILGQVDIHADYADPNPLPVGVVVIVNFNMFEPEAPSLISDTLSITFTGHVAGDGTNTSVDLHFLSGATDEALLPPALPNAFVVPENFDVSGLINQATSQFVAGGLRAAHVQFASVPEPSTFVMLGLGIASLFGYRLRKRVA